MVHCRITADVLPPALPARLILTEAGVKLCSENFVVRVAERARGANPAKGMQLVDVCRCLTRIDTVGHPSIRHHPVVVVVSPLIERCFKCQWAEVGCLVLDEAQPP